MALSRKLRLVFSLMLPLHHTLAAAALLVITSLYHNGTHAVQVKQSRRLPGLGEKEKGSQFTVQCLLTHQVLVYSQRQINLWIFTTLKQTMEV